MQLCNLVKSKRIITILAQLTKQGFWKEGRFDVARNLKQQEDKSIFCRSKTRLTFTHSYESLNW